MAFDLIPGSHTLNRMQIKGTFHFLEVTPDFFESCILGVKKSCACCYCSDIFAVSHLVW